MKKIYLLLFLIPFVVSQSQNIDSLFNSFVRIKGNTQITGALRITDEGQPTKCGFGILNQVRENYNLLSSQQKALYKKLSSRPDTDTSFVSPSGKFRIHFYKSGSEKPVYDINEFAKAADSAYNYEVNILGYPAPPSDFGNGGDDRYDVYIVNLSGVYGYTEFEDSITSNTYTAFTVLDNEFGIRFYTHGINAARVTIAHEFHHAIQIGNYIYRSSDEYYYELTSTSMEEFVFPDVDDYVDYLSTYFRNTQRSLSSTYIDNGYSRAIWNLFLAAEFDNSNVPSYVRGKNIIKRAWELMPNKRALTAISDAIKQAGSDFKTEFNKFGQWCYFTGIRSVSNKYFNDAAKFPLVYPTVLTSSITVSSEAASNNYFQMSNISAGVRDSVVTLVSNSDVSGGINSPVSVLSYTYTLSTQPISNGKKISDKYYSVLNPNSILLSEANMFTGIIFSTEINYAYPQPFKYSAYKELNFPVEKNGETTAELYIYSIDMDLVYSNDKNTVIANERITWDCLGLDGKKLGTGVYIYVTKSGDAIKKGKFVIYND
jgi:hypothetical protein